MKRRQGGPNWLLAFSPRHCGEWGVGGKTSSGYGRLTEADASHRRRAFSTEALGLPAVGTLVMATLLDAPEEEQAVACHAHTPLGKGVGRPHRTERADASGCGARQSCPARSCPCG